MPGIDQRFRHYPQLYSRLGFSHRYRALGRDELLFVLDRHWTRLGKTLDPDDFTDAQAIAAIERITRGNFRLLERLFPQIQRVLRINQLETITDGVIEAAASVLVTGGHRRFAEQNAATSDDRSQEPAKPPAVTATGRSPHRTFSVGRT